MKIVFDRNAEHNAEVEETVYQFLNDITPL